MAAKRYLLAPISGVFVATSLLYTFRHTMAVRTHDAALALHDVKLRLDDIDPDNWDKEGKQRVAQQTLRPAYVPPQKQSVTEEIKARWNEQVFSAVDTLANANYYDLFANGVSSAKSLFSKVGSAVEDKASSASSSGIKTGIISTQGVSLRGPTNAVQQAAQEAQQPGSKVGSRISRALGMDANKVEKVVEAKTGPGLGKVGEGGRGRTYYLGEGTSLR